MEISDHVTFRTAGLPSCTLARLYSAYRSARQSCAGSLVGHGTVISEITLPGQAPAVVDGRVLAFYNASEVRPHIFAQVTTGEPLPLIYVIPFAIGATKGDFKSTLVASQMHLIHGRCVPGPCGSGPHPYNLKGAYGHISDFKLSLHRLFAHNGKKQSFVSADCPASGNRPRAVFPLMGLGLRYADGSVVTGAVSGICKVSR